MNITTNRLHNIAIEKTAAMSALTLNAFAAGVGKTYLHVAKKVATHFKVPRADSNKLLMTKMRELPGVALELIDRNSQAVPHFQTYTNKVVAYNEPWNFMHEYAHAGNRTNILKKLRRVLPLNTKIQNKDYELINDYISSNYMNGGRKSRELGQNLHSLVDTTKAMKEKDTWRFLEEIRANSTAYRDTKNITNEANAYKVFQPLSIIDQDYSETMRELAKQRGVITK